VHSRPPSAGFSRAPGTKVAPVLAVLLLAFFSGGAVAQESTSRHSNTLAGSSLFGSKGCTDCHSIESLGVGGVFRREPITDGLSFFRLATRMWNHVPNMAVAGQEPDQMLHRLDSRDVANIVAFLFAARYGDAPADTASGHALYIEKQCVRCHQIGGIGGMVGPALDISGNLGTPIELASAMWNHAPRMAALMESKGIARATLTGSELLDLFAYVRSAATGVPEASPIVLPGSAAKGRMWFRQKGCEKCHGVPGEGGARGPDLARDSGNQSMADLAAAMWNKAPAMLAAMRSTGAPAPKLTATQMADIVAYLYSLRYFDGAGDPGAGRSRVREEGCLECHSLGGEGHGTATDLARSDGVDSSAGVIAALWNHVLLLSEIRPEGSAPWPYFEDGEMADVVAFLQTGR